MLAVFGFYVAVPGTLLGPGGRKDEELDYFEDVLISRAGAGKCTYFLSGSAICGLGGGPGPLLGPKLAVLGRFEAYVGGLGPLLGPMVAVLGRSWCLCWRPWGLLGRCWRVLGRSGAGPGHSQGRPGGVTTNIQATYMRPGPGNPCPFICVYIYIYIPYSMNRLFNEFFKEFWRGILGGV